MPHPLPCKDSRAEREWVWARASSLIGGRAQPGVAVPRGFLVNSLPAAPRGVWQVWQAKDLKLGEIGSVAGKGVMGGFFGCVANKEVRDWGLAVTAEGEAPSPSMFL